MNREPRREQAATGKLPRRFPLPTVRVVTIPQARAWLRRGYMQATDGCTVGPQEMCAHGHASWAMFWNLL